MIVEKEEVCNVDIAMPGDSRISEQQLEKPTRYRGLRV